MRNLGGGSDHPVVIAPKHSRFLSLPKGLTLAEHEAESSGPTFPEGFLASGIAAGLKESGRPDMGVIAVAPEWRSVATSAGVFTTNAFAAAPVVLNRSECDLGGFVAVVVNSGNANACTGGAGLSAARATQVATAEALGVDKAAVAVASTGIIGVQMDSARVAAGGRQAAEEAHAQGGADFGRSIITTDRFPKACAGTVKTPAGTIGIGACCKGAGMISPAMATMLCFVTTDAELTREQAKSLLEGAVARSFNQVTVDGEMSTNDSVFLLASGASGVKPDAPGLEELGGSLDAILIRLALMMVADGEGATKIMRLRVVGADSGGTASLVARAVADSPLVKTAMNGGDPNWGRIMSSAGAALAGRSLPAASLQLCGVTVVEKGAACPVPRTERAHMAAEMKMPEIDIKLNLGLGDCSTEIFFADLGHEYITINAEYHS
jgi:glutamate N-acetyltransferase / amino-acid N-acetyltransferase